MRFSEIIGNESIKEYLNKSIENREILHSYLFLGNSGIGKKLIAKEFAKKILCQENFKDDCNCKSCLSFDGDNNVDFVMVDFGENQIKVEYMRELIETIYQKPVNSLKKVYVINNFENANAASQNCLLKTLEEPPEYIVIILISSNESLILPTIKSRCMSLYFQNIENNLLLDYAKNVVGYKDVSNNLLEAFDGSIGKIYEYKEFENKFKEIDTFVDKISTLGLIDLMDKGRIFYDKGNDKDLLEKEKVMIYIVPLLNYLISSLYTKKPEIKYLNCIDVVEECINRLTSKISYNFDMTIDNMLIKMWKEFN